MFKSKGLEGFTKPGRLTLECVLLESFFIMVHDIKRNFLFQFGYIDLEAIHTD